MRWILALVALVATVAGDPLAARPPAATAGVAVPASGDSTGSTPGDEERGAEQVRQALARRAAGDVAGAIALLEPARGRPDAPALMLEALGALYLEAGRPADALAVLAPRTAVADPDPVVLFNTARAALALGRRDDAERYLTAAVRKAPVSRAALLLWEVLDGQQRHREAAAALAPLAAEPIAAEVERNDPDLAADVALEYARSLIAAGDQVAAIAPLQRRVRLRPDEEQSWKMLGDALLEAQRVDEARVALTRAQEVAERRRQAELAARAGDAGSALGFDGLMQRAAERQSAGDSAGALAALQDAIRASPRDPRPRMLEVQLQLRLGKADEALSRARELVELTGDRPEALYLRAMAFLATGDPARAEPDLRRVLEQVPDQVPAMNGLVEVLLARGELDEAERLSRRVLELSPGDPTAAAGLQEIAKRRAVAGGEGR